jgi:hypothetical protein
MYRNPAQHPELRDLPKERQKQILSSRPQRVAGVDPWLGAMRLFSLAVGMAIALSASAAAPTLPLRSGTYVFHHRFAEQPSMPSVDLRVRIRGTRVQVFNDSRSDAFPTGLIDSGTLMWHVQSRHWIVGRSRADRNAPEVGGCSDGPNVIDLDQRIYWTC